MYLFSYEPNSQGAKLLADALKAKRIKHENSRFVGGPKKIVINWGSSNPPEQVLKSRVINNPKAVGLCSNKLHFFNNVSGKCSVPDWTTNPKVAMEWVAEGHRVCARTVLQGHSAEGLVIMSKNNMESFTEAPLYTKYTPKKDEYRVHVINGEVIDVQRKALRSGWIAENEGQKPNWHIRNLANGFIYVRGDVNPPASVLNEARNAVAGIGLDFGAVDVIYQDKSKQAYVLEINTAPGIEGTTVVNYAAALGKIK